MGRGKIEIKKIENINSRQVTFSKRRAGLLKKARELSILCDAEVAVIIFSNTGKLFEFSSNGMKGTIDRYNKCQDSSETSIVEYKPKVNQKPELEPLDILKEELANLQLKHRHLLGKDLNGLSLQELQQLEDQLTQGFLSVKEKKERLLLEQLEHSRMQEQQANMENETLRHQVQELRTFLPPAEHSVPCYLEYYPTGLKNAPKNHSLKPEFPTENDEDSDTTLHLRPPSSSSRKRKSSHARTQTQALSNLYRAKLLNNNSNRLGVLADHQDDDDNNNFIDTSTFRFNAAELLQSQSQLFSSTNNIDRLKQLRKKDKIEKLPGQPDDKVDFDQYGGYVTVDDAAGRAFYYYFAEASRSKKSKLPLLLWLNGGPGCSSLAYGAMQELGPFRVRSDGRSLFRNKYSWNNAANVLFLESPAGVGFSYSNQTSDYSKSGDKSTASDNLVFLLNWFDRFPEYKDRDFYISGESYAGHYAPQLAHAILSHNKMSNNTVINLKGIIIGNAVINDLTDQIGMYDYFATHALASDEAVQQIKTLCDFSPQATKQTLKCLNAADEVDKDVFYLDIYNIYASLCFSPNLTSHPKKINIVQFDQCSEYYVVAYMNRPDVQRALHANATKIKYSWQPCSDQIKNWQDSPATIIPLLKEFIANDLRVWVFSGDTDGRVPVTSTKYSLAEMKLGVKTKWHPWMLDGEVGGYTEVFEGDLTFATVRGAGHQVPSYQPKRALSLISHFLSGTPLPNTLRYL
ncbi:unnamed protein product [Rhodiola kirilowii]